MTSYLNLSAFDIDLIFCFNFDVILTTDGRVHTCGIDDSGELGNGTTTTVQSPTDITSQFGLAAGETIIRIVALGGGAMAEMSTGRLFVSGANTHGQYGIGNTTQSLYPIEVDWFTLVE